MKATWYQADQSGLFADGDTGGFGSNADCVRRGNEFQFAPITHRVDDTLRDVWIQRGN